ncbi:carboxypeptidase-like regulatory domain-containing protein [Flaviaesturariibacter aridisoli]|uniref:Carboxypeptidase-like regulatory domain-containing protein n=1 Tax=Flaviaesturariibacter aridisoli TaxID=2545761 RepID=A0A4R4DVR4_9BACT|nr:carboxypeptidase-like regulatory domain-containing protein [Flaviaesturariibacter aridisoli]TCZ64640.1 carboxypeptidase-like regulatory domain-containing protein [Flaviaesturariibacter aridisoli]
MKKLSLLFFSTLLTLCSFAQGIVSGTVTDAETKQPLQGASVFAQNTTVGAVSKGDGTYKLSLGKGGYELVVSFTGYETQRFNIEATGDRTQDIALKKEDKSLTEVVIQSNNEVPDGWEKYGSFFLDYFIGRTANAKETKLENPQALKFFYYKRSDKLKVFASEPLRITNSALGYSLQYNLDSFVYYYKSGLNSYRGNCLFLPLEGDAAQQAAWAKARERAYLGSRLHFTRAYFDSTLKEDGFTVDLLSETSNTKFDRLTNPYDSAYYFADSTGNVELWFPRMVSISYTKARPEPAYLEQMNLPKNVPAQMSYVELRDAILVKPNGYFTEQRSWVNQGYWSWKNLADLLPYDYNP